VEIFRRCAVYPDHSDTGADTPVYSGSVQHQSVGVAVRICYGRQLFRHGLSEHVGDDEPIDFGRQSVYE